MRFAWASSPRSTCRERCLFSFFCCRIVLIGKTPNYRSLTPKRLPGSLFRAEKVLFWDWQMVRDGKPGCPSVVVPLGEVFLLSEEDAQSKSTFPGCVLGVLNPVGACSCSPPPPPVCAPHPCRPVMALGGRGAAVRCSSEVHRRALAPGREPCGRAAAEKTSSRWDPHFGGESWGEKSLGIAAGGMLLGLHKEKWVWRFWVRTVLWRFLLGSGLVPHRGVSGVRGGDSDPASGDVAA